MTDGTIVPRGARAGGRAFGRLAGYLALTGLRKEARQSLFGYAWWLLEPALHTLLYYVVFAIVLKNPQPDFFAMLIVGIAFWRWFGSGVSQGTLSVTENGLFLRSFPLSTSAFVVSATIEAALRILPVLVLAVLLVRGVGEPPSAVDLWMVPILLTQALLILGLSAHLSWIMVYVPDTRQAIEIALRAGLFLSGVFYSARSVPEDVRWIFTVNPVAAIIEAARTVLIHREAPDGLPLAIAATLAAVLCVTGLAVHRRLRGRLATLLLQ